MIYEIFYQQMTSLTAAFNALDRFLLSASGKSIFEWLSSGQLRIILDDEQLTICYDGRIAIRDQYKDFIFLRNDRSLLRIRYNQRFHWPKADEVLLPHYYQFEDVTAVPGLDLLGSLEKFKKKIKKKEEKNVRLLCKQSQTQYRQR